MTKAALLAAVNTYLAANQPITANGMHKPSMHTVINEMYDAQSRADILAAVTSALSLDTGDKVFIIRGSQGRLVDKDLVINASGDVDGGTP
jgi:hypothetical protein